MKYLIYIIASIIVVGSVYAGFVYSPAEQLVNELIIEEEPTEIQEEVEEVAEEPNEPEIIVKEIIKEVLVEIIKEVPIKVVKEVPVDTNPESTIVLLKYIQRDKRYEDEDKFSIINQGPNTVVINHLIFSTTQKKDSVLELYIEFPDSIDKEKFYSLGVAEVSNNLTVDISISCKKDYDGHFPKSCRRHYRYFNIQTDNYIRKIIKEAKNEIRPGEKAIITVGPIGLSYHRLTYVSGSITEKLSGNDIPFKSLSLYERYWEIY